MTLTASSNRFVPAGWQANREALHGVEPADVLLAERDKIMARLAPLRAVYGSFGVADHQRKVELARCRQIVQAQSVRDGKRLTVDDLDMLARLHEDYMGYLAQMVAGRTEWITLEGEVESIDFKLLRGQALLRLAASEPR
jgi:hypothetical protein